MFLTFPLPFHSAALSGSARINTCQDGDRVAKMCPLLVVTHYEYLCIPVCVSAALCDGACCVLDHLSFKFMLQIVCVLLPELNLPVNANACHEEDLTKRKGRATGGVRMTFPAEFFKLLLGPLKVNTIHHPPNIQPTCWICLTSSHSRRNRHKRTMMYGVVTLKGEKKTT